MRGWLFPLSPPLVFCRGLLLPPMCHLPCTRCFTQSHLLVYLPFLLSLSPRRLPPGLYLFAVLAPLSGFGPPSPFLFSLFSPSPFFFRGLLHSPCGSNCKDTFCHSPSFFSFPFSASCQIGLLALPLFLLLIPAIFDFSRSPNYFFT